MKPIHILLVEDNEGDIMLTRESLEEAKIIIKLSVVRDGKQALEFLTKQGGYRDAELPDLLLLDVNLPKKNGHEVLKYIKTSEGLSHIPVIILTTSSSDKDIDLSHNNYASCYITKPLEASNFLALVGTIENFWVTVIKLPTSKNL